MEQMATTIREGIMNESVQGSGGEKEACKDHEKTAPKAEKATWGCPKCGAKMVLRNRRTVPSGAVATIRSVVQPQTTTAEKPVFKK